MCEDLKHASLEGYTDGMIDALGIACVEMNGVLAKLDEPDASLASVKTYAVASYERLSAKLDEVQTLKRVADATGKEG